MSRRQRQHDELRRLCQSGVIGRAIDLAFEHFADFGPDDDILRLLAETIEHAPVSAAVRSRFDDLRSLPPCT